MKAALFAFLFLTTAAIAEITWLPDDTSNRIIMVVKGGVFTPDLYLPLTWKWAQDYDEMAWCTFQNGKWLKVYPFGEDGNQALFKQEWLKKSRWQG